jgi:DNA-binding NarL/FixJ family response regulator
LFRASDEAADAAGAAYWAFFHGFRLLALHEAGRGSAWLQRARRHAESAGDQCAVHGYLLLPEVIRHVIDHAWEAANRSALEALAIANRCKEVDLEALARCWLGRALVMQGRVDQGIAVLDEAMLLALDDALSPVVTGLVYCNLIASCWQVYAYDRAREWTAALERWCNAQPQLVQFGGACQLHRAEILEMDGAWEQALAAAREAAQREAAEDVCAGAAYRQGEIHRLRGEWQEAERCYAEALRRGMDPEPGCALVQLAAGRGEKAAAMLQRSLAAVTLPIARARLLPALVDALLHTGQVEAAAVAAAELQDLASSFPSAMLQAVAAQALARVRLARSDAAGALPALEQTLSAWLRLSAPYLAAVARVDLASACGLLGDTGGMRMHLEAARDCFGALGAAPALEKMEMLLRAAAPDPRPAGLSPRELEVLRLLAAGHTNKRIARELGLSSKTVDRHLGNIFDKLQVHTRSAATAFAYQHGLVTAS